MDAGIPWKHRVASRDFVNDILRHSSNCSIQINEKVHETGKAHQIKKSKTL